METLTMKTKKTKIAEKNIEKFLRILDAESSEDADDIYLDSYFSNIFERKCMAELLNEYDSRKRQTQKDIKAILKKSIEKSRNGFRYLNREQKYSKISEGRYELEEVLRNSRLGQKDAKALLVPALCKFYRIYGFNNFHNYCLRRKLYLSH